MQSGEADVAIAFATALSHAFHPGAYIFDQNLMRSHLLQMETYQCKEKMCG